MVNRRSWTANVRALCSACALVSIVVLSTSCAGWFAGAAPSYRVATVAVSPSGFLFQALMNGRLAGQVNQDGTACFWVHEGEDRTYMLWPDGWSAHGNPLGVFNQAGVQVATVGQTLNFGGGMLYADELKTAVIGCGVIKRAFLVGEVQK